MSPISHCLVALRVRHDIRQGELATLLGYEQSYISALEVGIKGPPTPDFIEKLIETLSLGDDEAKELRLALAASERKLILPPDAPTSAYWLVKDLREHIESLHPAQVRLIREILRMPETLQIEEPEPLRRIKRRSRRKGAAM